MVHNKINHLEIDRVLLKKKVVFFFLIFFNNFFNLL